jgi:hypothetical protein
MSRAYWVKLSTSVSDTIQANDRATHKIDLEAVVPVGEMRDIVSEALADAGWELQEDGSFEKRVGEVTLSWDLSRSEVDARVEASQSVTQDVHVEGRGYDQTLAQSDAEQRLEREATRARDALAGEQERLQQKLTETLGASEEGRVREINEVLQRAYAEAVKRKARRMGNVTSVQESTSDDGEYQLTITISE